MLQSAALRLVVPDYLRDGADQISSISGKEKRSYFGLWETLVGISHIYWHFIDKTSIWRQEVPYLLLSRISLLSNAKIQGRNNPTQLLGETIT